MTPDEDFDAPTPASLLAALADLDAAAAHVTDDMLDRAVAIPRTRPRPTLEEIDE